MFRYLLLAFSGLSFGALASAGVFTVLAAIGLVPRFAGKTHTGKYVFLYEEAVIFGTVAGCFLSVFGEYSQVGTCLRKNFPDNTVLWEILGSGALAVFGLFCGLFVGCLALAIAEMLDSIPIFARRVSLRHGIGLAVSAMAFGKLAGSLLYFLWGLH